MTTIIPPKKPTEIALKSIKEKVLAGGGLEHHEAVYILDVLQGMREDLIFVQKNTLFYRDQKQALDFMIKANPNTVVSQAAIVQLRARHGIEMGSGL